MRYRQVHLDFHTSEHIPAIGAEFDPDEFAGTLKSAHVDSVTLFSRCHHGWVYHPTKVGQMHPGLSFDLLGEQIRACHKADIRCPVYITVGWDELQARTHPEWIEVHEDGRRDGAAPGQAGWHKLDFLSPYLDYVEAQTEEVIDRFGDELDGLFMDIIFVSGVHSPWCMAEYQRLGLDPADKAAQAAMRERAILAYLERMSSLLARRKPGLPIFHNGGHVSPQHRHLLDHYSHLELESLPTGGWGYMHFPLTARYARALAQESGKHFLGMTGKFSETWGHFQSYKPEAALQFECLSSVAMGGRCSVGDQLHPSGRLDKDTYRLIGSAYQMVESVEARVANATPFAEIGVFTAAEGAHGARIPESDSGVVRALTQGRHQFNFVDSGSPLDQYRMLVLTDSIRVDDALAARIDAFVAGGGALLAAGRGGMRPSGDGFALDCLPGDWAGELPMSPDFALPGEELALDRAAPFVMYERGAALKAKPDAQVLASHWNPYFERTWEHFCSHNHAPHAGPSGLPAALQKGSVVQAAHPVFETLARHAMPLHRQYILSLVDRVFQPLVTCTGPTTLQMHLLVEGKKLFVFLLNYCAEQRAPGFDLIEDPLPILNARLSVRGEVVSAMVLPSGQHLEVEAGSTLSLPQGEGWMLLEVTLV